MKSEPDSGPIWSAWANGKALVGPNKPHSRITVQPSWWLNTTNVAGTRPPAKLPIRYFQTLANDQQEIEIPGVRTMEVDYDVDQDVATLTVQLVNNRFDPDYGSSEWQNSNGDFGRPGYLTGDRGSVSNRWGYVPNEWSGLLVRNALLRCVDTETEILTKRGWLRWDEVDVGDETLGIDPDTGLTEWQEIVEVFRDWHTGGMLPLQGRVHDSLTTRDHRWLLKESDGSFKWSTSEKLRKPSRIPMAARQAAPPEPTYDDAFVELAAWYFTEGTAEHRLRSLDHGGSIAQSIKENPHNVLRIRGVLERLFGAPGPLPRGVFVSQDTVDEVLALRSEGLSYRRIAEKVGVSRHSVERWVRGIRRTTKSFRWNEIPRRTSPDMHDFKFTQAVGRELRKVIVGPDKIPDPRFLASLTQSQAELFIEVSVLADGTDDDGALSFIQGNLERTKAFEMACVLAGQPVHTRGSGTIRKSSLLSVDVCRPAPYEPGAVGRPRNDDERARRREVPYDGIVWCPRVKHGNWVARRNGSVYFTGNTYEGYGGQEKTLEQALADGNLVLSGVWLVDDVPIKTGQGFELQARNTGKLLVDQYLYPPLIPAGDYPMSRARFFYSSTTLTTAQVIYGTNGLPNSKYRILRIERSLTDGYWLVGTDGGVFTFGPAHFQGSIDSIGLTITPGAYPSEGVTGISRSHTGDGYWLVTDTGAVYSFGDATYHGGASLSDPPAHPIIAIETAGTRDGYWLIGDDGGVFSFGDVSFYGSLPPLVAGAKIVDGASTPDGLGYWLVDNFGHVYSFGPSANYFGGITGALSAPIVAIASSPSGNGYVMTGKDGGVFAFGDASFFGSVPGLTPPIVLNDPVCDIVVTSTGNGYWLAAEDGGVFAFGDAGFYGSMPQPDTITTTTTTDGNYLDITDIAKDIFLYAGFNLYDGGATDNVYGVVESTGIYVPDEGGNVLDATFFDKLPCQDPLTKLKEIVGYLMYVGDEGEIHWHEPNFFESGNFLPDHTHTATVPVIDERVQLTSYQVNTPDKDLRSEIIISSEDPDAGIAGTVTTSFTPSTARELRGLVRPAMWVNEAFVDSATQQTMAELIALHIYFKSRLGTVTCIGNPLIQIDDQVQILERETFETNTHYVRRIHRTHDRKAGTYTMSLTTNVLSPPGSWAVVKPTGTPEGSIVVRRP